MKNTLQQKAQLFFKHLNFKKLTAIQDLTYSRIMNNEDLIVQSATGSGKTHAFLFPLMDKIETSKKYTQAMIIAPTRELSMQLYNFASEMKEIDSDLSISLLIGGQERAKTLIDSHIVIGTPGRLNDEFKSGMLLAQSTETVIIDEADMIWEYGFLDDLAEVLSRISNKHQTLVFSATIPEALHAYLRKVMTQPQNIENKEKSQFNPQISHYLIQDIKDEPAQVILDIMRTIQMSGAIIFANTREEASTLAEELLKYGLDVLELHGDLTPRKRKQTLNRLISDQHFILVATDIAARGLDLPYVSHVFSVGLPSHLNFYFHRAGRTGRAGREGTTFVLVDKTHREPVLKLIAMGVDFKYKRILNNSIQDAQNFYQKKVYHKKVDPQIQAVANRKLGKVKPNYRKKRKLEIEKLQRKKHRQMIQDDIAKQKKERAKARSKSNHS
ncbi:MAG TPA: DEAD/DEAH box helicase [Erysipelothrix sp.]|nr:DEAD/DEAH box helicase [Erysipelothrix sp.]